MIDFNSFTTKSQEIIQHSLDIAQGYGHQQIENPHLAKALLENDQNVTPFILKKLKVNVDNLVKGIEMKLNRYPKVVGGEHGFSKKAASTLQQAVAVAKKKRDEFASVEHLFIALFKAEGTVRELLQNQEVNEKKLEDAINEIRKGSTVTSQTFEGTYNALEKYARNLNKLAAGNKLDPLIGRDEEIRRILQILSRRSKNNPMLIGEPGVGKTAIAEGLAGRIVKGDVPENLKSKQIFSLDMGALIAGAKYKGEFEERLKSVVREVLLAGGDIMMFIDEIHTLVGAGGGEGAMDAANILKPALARGELRAIGATTLDEYQKYFEKDKALERRFQKVMVDEPDTESAIIILRGIKDKYEAHHKIRIKDEAVIASVKLSQRYISSRFLPDKAIDLMDESAAKIRMKINFKPEELDKIERKIMNLEVEIEGIKLGQSDREVKKLQKEAEDFKKSSDNSQQKMQKEIDIESEKPDRDTQKMARLNIGLEKFRKESNDEYLKIVDAVDAEILKSGKSGKRLSLLKKEIAELKSNRDQIYTKWKNEKELIDNIQQIKESIEKWKLQAEKAEREGNYGLVAELRYGKIKAAQENLEAMQEEISNEQTKFSVKEEVTAEDIAETVAKWTGIPVQKMIQSERDKLLKLEDELHQRVVGQEEGIEAIANAIRRSRAGLHDSKKPIGSFLFLGTTGVGKTELAKALADYLFDDENALTRIDMSEYQESHAVSRLVGAPPGYIGYDEGGQLTEAVRRQPYSVILLDEIEKAHPDTFNVLLQVLDEGRLTDNKGRLADFKNTVIIMTSNMGAAIIQEKFGAAKMEDRNNVAELVKEDVFKELKKYVRPEFLNRIDEIVMFTPLNQKEIREIVTLQLKSLAKMLTDQQISIESTDKAIDLLTEKGYDPQYGARPVKRVIQREVLNAISKEILAGNIIAEQQIILDADMGAFVFRNK